MERITSRESIISPNYQRMRGKEVWRENVRQAVFAADKIRSTLGPKGAYKLVAYNRGPEQVVKVTRDAIAILDELAIEYPPAVIVAEAAKMQRQEAGDGVATFVVLLAALLRKADELMTMGIHANTVIHGYHLATEKALEILEKQATTRQSDVLDTVDCGRNILTPKIRSMIREAYPLSFSSGKFELENIRFLKRKGGALEDSSLIHGIVVKREKAHPSMPDHLSNLRIALISERLGLDRLEVKMRGEGPIPFKLKVRSPDQIGRYKETERKLKTRGFEKLGDLKVNTLLCEQPIEEYQKTLLLAGGVFAVERADKKDTQAIAKACGARIVGNLNELVAEDIGAADELYTDKIELEKTVTFEGCKGATFVLRGNIPQVVDELETAIQNGLTMLKVSAEDGRVLPGGGAVEAQLARELKDYSKVFPIKEQVAVEAFSRALMDVPWCLAENYGLDAADTTLELRRLHAEGGCYFGICQHSCGEWVCVEPLKVKRAVIRRAYEVASLMLRVDELLISKEIAKFHRK